MGEVKFLYQDDLKLFVDKTDYRSFPKVCGIVGALGSGKSTFIRYVGDVYGTPIVYLPNKAEELREILDRMESVHGKIIYAVSDIYRMSKESRQMLLKSLEEPQNDDARYMIEFISQDRSDTISSRCVMFNLKPYSVENLKTFSTDEEILEVSCTPGDCIFYSEHFNERKDAKWFFRNGGSITGVETLKFASEYSIKPEENKKSFLTLCRALSTMCARCIDDITYNTNNPDIATAKAYLDIYLYLMGLLDTLGNKMTYTFDDTSFSLSAKPFIDYALLHIREMLHKIEGY